MEQLINEKDMDEGEGKPTKSQRYQRSDIVELWKGGSVLPYLLEI